MSDKRTYSLADLATFEAEQYSAIGDVTEVHAIVVVDLDKAKQALEQYLSCTADAAHFNILLADVPDWIQPDLVDHLVGNNATYETIKRDLLQGPGPAGDQLITALLQDQPYRANTYLESIGRAMQALDDWLKSRNRKSTEWDPAGLKVIESFVASPARESLYADPPEWVLQSPAWEAARSLTNDLRLYKHQAKALDMLGNGANLIVSTGTASGKSLIFQIPTIDLLARNLEATAIAIYPIRALSRDQMQEWRRMVAIAGLGDSAVGILDGSEPETTSQNRDALRRERLSNTRLCLMTPDIIQAWLLANAHSPDTSSVPNCPLCGARMTERGNRNTADRFWGCTQYRQAGCRGTINIGGPTNHIVRQFIRNLEMVIIDEAHNYEAAFGTNMAYLMQRIIDLKRRLAGTDAKPPRLIAASATIADPERHMERLTRQPFVAVTEDDNGAPKAELTMVHIPVSTEDRYDISVSNPETVEHIAKSIKRITQSNPELRFIAFSDSRQRVEAIAGLVESTDHVKELSIIEDADLVMSYQADHSATAREMIEGRLQKSSIPGVISTSALEMGIDIADLSLGINIGKPKSVSSLRQRAGRVGRTRPATFIVITPKNDFAMDGGLQAYWSRNIDEAYFYDENDYLRGAHALCSAKEQNRTAEAEYLSHGHTTADTDQLVDSSSQQPDGFNAMVARAAAGNYDESAFGMMTPTEKERRPIHQNPHQRFSFRGELDPDVRIIRRGEHNDDVEDSQSRLLVAMNDAYPLATYRYMKQTYHITNWQNYEKETRIDAVKREGLPTTRAIHKAGLKITLAQDTVMTKTMPDATLSVTYGRATSFECIIGIESYLQGQWEPRLYSDQNPPIPVITRSAPTTATVITITPDQIEMDEYRCEELAQQLRTALSHLENIRIEDLMVSGTNVEVITENQSSTLVSVAIWDRFYGGMGLTRSLYDDLSRYIQAILRVTQRPPKWLEQIREASATLELS